MSNTAPLQTGVLAERPSGTTLKSVWILPILGLAVGWLLVFNVLRADWSTNAQYYYGWFVPVLAAGLFRLRRTSQPPVAPASHLTAIAVAATAALVFLLPIRLIEEANPEWRLVQWTHALQMVLVSVCFVYYVGGWAWVKHYAFPILFMLVAVPWPVPLEHHFVQDLMRVIAAVTVELVGLFGIPAVQHGNIIQIKAGFVGIDEACSGVRSLQSAFFICLFLGELYRFSWGRRAWLVLLGFGVALLANLGRTFYLVWEAFYHGLDRMHEVHDTAGQIVLVFTLIGIWVVSQALYRKTISAPVERLSPGSVRVLPKQVALYALAWLVVVELTTEAWYRLHESQALPSAHWTAEWPQSPHPAQSVKIDDTVRAMLRFNEGREGQWQDAEGNSWQAYFFCWAAGRNSAQLASAHTPDICLRGVGCHLTKDLGTHDVFANGLHLPIHQFVFERGGVPLHVFYCRWEDQLIGQVDTSYEDGSKTSRLRAVLAGRRHLGEQVLEAIVSGPETAEQGLAALRQQLPQLIRR